MKKATVEEALILLDNVRPLLKAQPADIVSTAAEAEEAIEMARAVKVAHSALSDAKDKATRPMLDALETERSNWMPKLKELVAIESLLKRAVLSYQAAAQRAQDEAMNRARIASKQAAEGMKAISRLPAGPVESPPHEVLAAIGAATDALGAAMEAAPIQLVGAHTRKLSKWRITDPSKIPAVYLMTVVNEQAVNVAVAAGVASIPGIEIYEEVSLTVRK